MGLIYHKIIVKYNGTVVLEFAINYALIIMLFLLHTKGDSVCGLDTADFPLITLWL